MNLVYFSEREMREREKAFDNDHDATVCDDAGTHRKFTLYNINTFMPSILLPLSTP